MLKKSEATKERILEAATEEFALYGIAGARMDRIAAIYRGNKSLIYTYFGSKEKLFRAVLNRHTQRVLDEVPFTPDDLAAYGVGLFDFAMAHPKLMRLMSWYGLEQRKLEPEERLVVFATKVREIAAAQRRGAVAKHLPADFLLSSIIALASSYSEVNAFREAIYPETANRLPKIRRALVKAIHRLSSE